VCVVGCAFTVLDTPGVGFLEKVSPRTRRHRKYAPLRRAAPEIKRVANDL
jgi:hypothetical protein